MKFLAALMLLSLSSAYAESIVGQTADYILDKDPKRTMSMIKSGTVKATIRNFLPASQRYEVDIAYKMNVSLMGIYEGSQSNPFEKEFFTPEFLENLRKNGFYNGAYFKAKHRGYADTKTLNGKFYKHCDVVFLYDLQEPPPLLDGIADILGIRGGMQDMTALVHIYPGIPVLGAVKIDVAGKYSGMKIKAGGDYVGP